MTAPIPSQVAAGEPCRRCGRKWFPAEADHHLDCVPPASSQVAADLRAAADVLERDGWTQGAFHRATDDGAVCHCAAGAIEVSTGFDKNASQGDRWAAALTSFGASLLVADNPGAVDIYRWNDRPERTAAEVIAALRSAAAVAEGAQ